MLLCISCVITFFNMLSVLYGVGTGDERLTPLCHDRSLDDRPGNLDGWASMVGLITALSDKDDVLLHA